MPRELLRPVGVGESAGRVVICNETRYPSPMLRACFVAVVRDVEGGLTRHPLPPWTPLGAAVLVAQRAERILASCRVT